MTREIYEHKLYKHFKGTVYHVLSIAKHTETGELMVIYANNDYDVDRTIYARPLSMFASEVDRDKYPDVTQKYRFELMEV